MTNLIPGKLWTYFLNAILITIPASFVLLVSYRHAVSRSMRLTSSAAASLADGSGRTVVSTLAEGSWAGEEPVRAARRRIALVYAIGGLVGAAIMAFLFALAMHFDISARAAFASWYIFAWPLIPTTVALLAWPQSRNTVLLLAYAAVGAAVIWASSFLSAHVFGTPDISPIRNTKGFVELLVRQAWLPYVIILLTGNRRLRPVSPLVLACLLVFSFGSLAARDLYVAGVDSSPIGPWLLFSGSNTYSLWYFIAALPIGYLCWRGLRWLARSYDQKRFSDVQLLVDSWWLIVAFQFSTELANDFGWAGLAGLLAFVGYRGSVQAGLRFASMDSLPTHGPRLLLLRVFGFQRRTESLFDAVAERWRFAGPVMLIAGVDLAMRTVNPGEIASFMSGRLMSVLITNEKQAQCAVSSIDTKRDPDGRFRTTKCFCQEDTWQLTLLALLARSDVVLMDLRGLTETNRGILFELESLLAYGLVPRTLFIVDKSTDVDLLERTLVQRAAALGKPEGSVLHRWHLDKQSSTELKRIYEALRRLVTTSS